MASNKDSSSAHLRLAPSASLAMVSTLGPTIVISAIRASQVEGFISSKV